MRTGTSISALAPASARRSALLRALIACALAAAALTVAACGVKSPHNANLIAGKRAFVSKCGSCHTLARAATKGIVGPNLDNAFGSSANETGERNTIRGVVEGQIANPNPEGAMPQNLVSGKAKEDIAAYVALVAGKSGKDKGLLASAVEAPGAGKPAVEKAGKLSIEASPSGQLAYVTNKATAEAGQVTIEMPNMSGVSHNIAIESGEGGATPKGSKIGASEFTTKTTAKVSVTLKAGTYTFFCEAPGHRAAGMYGTITVK
ncbi:MAG TPA: plastocyanin/azurin family copper-binding protein [Solirubrobacteraceae bacterium]|nr:plastocyanin/azurin family copper-binding protein [Solirubrobacteraceae bacterium]